MTGIPLLIAFVIAIIIMIVAIAKWKIHPFLSIMGVSLILAIIAGIKLTDIPVLSALASPAPSLPSVLSSSLAHWLASFWKRPALPSRWPT